MLKLPRKLTGPPKLIGVILLVVCGGALVSIVIGGGVLRYQASIEWINKSVVIAIAVGLVMAFWTVWFFLPAVSKKVSSGRLGSRKAFTSLTVTAVFSFFLGGEAVIVTGPMVLASVVGRDVELAFTLEGTGSYSRGCRKSVVLRGYPTMHNTICGMSDSFLDRVTSGTQVVVSGRGTPLGLFVESARILGHAEITD